MITQSHIAVDGNEKITDVKKRTEVPDALGMVNPVVWTERTAKQLVCHSHYVCSMRY